VSRVRIETNESLITSIEALALPISVAYAKLHIKKLNSAEDVLVEAWIREAAQYFRELTNYEITFAEWEFWLDGFPQNAGKIELPHPPLAEVLSVEYVGPDGTYLNFSDLASPETVFFDVTTPAGVHARRGYVLPITGRSWPTPSVVRPDAVKIRYRAGYGADEDSVPALVKGILCRLVGAANQFRSEVHLSERGSKLEQLPLGSDQLLSAFKYASLPSVALWRDGCL
jgi:hypothetical protein